MTYYCSQCKADITEEEYNYSKDKFNKALCREHQKTINGKKEETESDGLSKKQEKYKEGMIKGRIAEALVEEMFLSLGYGVFRYGMENTVPGIMDLLKKGVNSNTLNIIRKMPDFVIQNKKGEVFFVEVKFRASEEFSFDNLDANYPFKNCYFILVSRKHIKCISYKELEQGEKITPEDKKYLGSRKEFDLDKEIIIDFCRFAVKFFKEVD